MSKFFEILAYLRNYKLNVGLNVVFNLLNTIFSLFSFATVIPFLKILFQTEKQQNLEKPPPLEMSSGSILRNLDYEVSHFILEQGEQQALLIFCGVIIVMFLLKNITRYFALYNLAPIRNGVVRDLRQDVYAKTLKLPLSWYSEERKGNIISRMTNDVSEIEFSIIGSIELLFKEPIAIIIFLGSLLFMSWKLTIFVLILLPLSGYLITRIGKSLKGAAQRGQSKLGEVLSIIEETLSGMRIIKAFNAEETTFKKFRDHNDNFFQLMVKLFRRQYLASPFSEFMGAVVLVIILYLGGQIVLKDSPLTGEFFIGYLVIFSQLIPPAKSFSDAFFKIQKGLAAYDRLNEILLADVKIVEATNPKPLKDFKENIEYRNVNFRYEVDYVLKDINLEIKKGKMVALVGKSGGGKSTLADLLPRFYDIEEGEILIDGTNIKQFSSKDLRQLMGIVTQESILFNDTVFNNITLGKPDATQEEVEQAAKIANAHDFILQLGNGYQSNIGESGTKLSGGQRQRLSIARAVLKNPPILILDEATSALDTESEKLVQDALNKLMKNRTSLVIAHRLSTIQNADKIVVMEDGKIMESGTHDELLEKEGVYRKLYELQSFD